MTELEKKILLECLTSSVKCSVNTIYESLALLFEEMSKHHELTLQQVLIGMSITLKRLAKENKDE